MGIFDRSGNNRDRRNDPECPLNVAAAKVSSLYGFGPKTSLMITRNPNHPVCSKCKRKKWWNCETEKVPKPAPKTKATEKKEQKEKKEEVALEGLKTLFG